MNGVYASSEVLQRSAIRNALEKAMSLAEGKGPAAALEEMAATLTHPAPAVVEQALELYAERVHGQALQAASLAEACLAGLEQRGGGAEGMLTLVGALMRAVEVESAGDVDGEGGTGAGECVELARRGLRLSHEVRMLAVPALARLMAGTIVPSATPGTVGDARWAVLWEALLADDELAVSSLHAALTRTACGSSIALQRAWVRVATAALFCARFERRVAAAEAVAQRASDVLDVLHLLQLQQQPLGAEDCAAAAKQLAAACVQAAAMQLADSSPVQGLLRVLLRLQQQYPLALQPHLAALAALAPQLGLRGSQLLLQLLHEAQQPLQQQAAGVLQRLAVLQQALLQPSVACRAWAHMLLKEQAAPESGSGACAQGAALQQAAGLQQSAGVSRLLMAFGCGAAAPTAVSSQPSLGSWLAALCAALDRQAQRRSAAAELPLDSSLTRSRRGAAAEQAAPPSSSCAAVLLGVVLLDGWKPQGAKGPGWAALLTVLERMVAVQPAVASTALPVLQVQCSRLTWLQHGTDARPKGEAARRDRGVRQLQLLRLLCRLGKQKDLVPHIGAALRPLASRDADTRLRCGALTLLWQLWHASRCGWQQLAAALKAFGAKPRAAGDAASPAALRLARAVCLARLCEQDPGRALQLIGPVQEAVEDGEDGVAAQGMACVASLCEAGVLDFYAAWRVIHAAHPALPQTPRLASEWVRLLRHGAADAEANASKAQAIVQLLWSGMRHSDPGIRAASSQALACFPPQLLERWQREEEAQAQAEAEEAEAEERGVPYASHTCSAAVEALLCERDAEPSLAHEQLLVKWMVLEHSQRRRYQAAGKSQGSGAGPASSSALRLHRRLLYKLPPQLQRRQWPAPDQHCIALLLQVRAALLDPTAASAQPDRSTGTGTAASRLALLQLVLQDATGGSLGAHRRPLLVHTLQRYLAAWAAGAAAGAAAALTGAWVAAIEPLLSQPRKTPGPQLAVACAAAAAMAEAAASAAAAQGAATDAQLLDSIVRALLKVLGGGAASTGAEAAAHALGLTVQHLEVFQWPLACDVVRGLASAEAAAASPNVAGACSEACGRIAGHLLAAGVRDAQSTAAAELQSITSVAVATLLARGVAGGDDAQLRERVLLHLPAEWQVEADARIAAAAERSSEAPGDRAGALEGVLSGIGHLCSGLASHGSHPRLLRSLLAALESYPRAAADGSPAGMALVPAAVRAHAAATAAGLAAGAVSDAEAADVLAMLHGLAVSSAAEGTAAGAAAEACGLLLAQALHLGVRLQLEDCDRLVHGIAGAAKLKCSAASPARDCAATGLAWVLGAWAPAPPLPEPVRTAALEALEGLALREDSMHAAWLLMSACVTAAAAHACQSEPAPPAAKALSGGTADGTAGGQGAAGPPVDSLPSSSATACVARYLLALDAAGADAALPAGAALRCLVGVPALPAADWAVPCRRLMRQMAGQDSTACAEARAALVQLALAHAAALSHGLLTWVFDQLQSPTFRKLPRPLQLQLLQQLHLPLLLLPQQQAGSLLRSLPGLVAEAAAGATPARGSAPAGEVPCSHCLAAAAFLGIARFLSALPSSGRAGLQPCREAAQLAARQLLSALPLPAQLLPGHLDLLLHMRSLLLDRIAAGTAEPLAPLLPLHSNGRARQQQPAALRCFGGEDGDAELEAAETSVRVSVCTAYPFRGSTSGTSPRCAYRHTHELLAAWAAAAAFLHTLPLPEREQHLQPLQPPEGSRGGSMDCAGLPQRLLAATVLVKAGQLPHRVATQCIAVLCGAAAGREEAAEGRWATLAVASAVALAEQSQAVQEQHLLQLLQLAQASPAPAAALQLAACCTQCWLAGTIHRSGGLLSPEPSAPFAGEDQMFGTAPAASLESWPTALFWLLRQPAWEVAAPHLLQLVRAIRDQLQGRGDVGLAPATPDQELPPAELQEGAGGAGSDPGVVQVLQLALLTCRSHLEPESYTHALPLDAILQLM